MAETTWHDFREADIAPDRIIAKEIEGDPHTFQHLGANDYFGGLEETGLVVKPLETDDKLRSIWLTNGGRVDRKASGIVKYAAPESLGVFEALATEEVGLRTLAAIAKKQGGVVFFHAASAVHVPSVPWQARGTTSRSMHENFLYIQPPDRLERAEDQERLATLLNTFFALRVILTGAGLPTINGFHLSQRSHAIGTPAFAYSGMRNVHGYKPMANLEHDLSEGPLRRIEDTSADANHSVIARLLSKASTSLMLRLIEHHHRLAPGQQKALRGLSIVDSIATLRGASEDLTLKQTYEFRDGTRRTAVQALIELGELAQDLTRQVLLPRDEELGLGYLMQALDILQRTNPAAGEIGEAAEFGLDWALLLEYLLAQTGLPVARLTSANNAVVEATLRWHALPEKQPRVRQVHQKTLQTLNLGQLVAQRAAKAPPGTRAHLRSELVRHERHNLKAIYNGGLIVWKNGKEVRLRPYQTTLDEVNA